MSWARLDDGFHDHPKVAPLANRNDPLNVWVRLLSWCSKHRTRGAIPRDVALVFGSKKTLAKLVDRRLFEETADGYQFHDFGVYASKQDGLVDPELSAKRAEAGRRGGLRSVEARRPEQEVPDPPDQAKPEASLLPAHQASCLKQTKQNAPSRADARARPDPDPIPIPEKSSTSQANRSAPAVSASDPIGTLLAACPLLIASDRPLVIAGSIRALRTARAEAEVVEAVQYALDGLASALSREKGVGVVGPYLVRTVTNLLAAGGLEAARSMREPRPVPGRPGGGTGQQTDLAHELAEMERTHAATSPPRSGHQPTKLGDVSTALASLAHARRSAP